VAFGFYSPIVAYLDEEATSGQHTYWLDFAIIWALYAVTMVVLRSLMAAASKTKLRFKNPIDTYGGPAVGFVAAWVLAAFTLATFHTSPMPKNAFSGRLVYNDADTASSIWSPRCGLAEIRRTRHPAAALGSGSTDKFSAKGFVKITPTAAKSSTKLKV